MKMVTLPSGAKLEIGSVPFGISRELHQALLEELKALRLDPDAEVDVNFFKDIFCAGFSSKKVDAALKKCLERALYNDKKMVDLDAIFEPEEARQDFYVVCFEVAQEVTAPFVKHLYAKYKVLLESLISAQA